jgi:hypothetical protein
VVEGFFQSEAFWQLPLPILLIAFLSLGVFVTRREYMNMVKQMEYYRTLSETRDGTISTLVSTVGEFKDLSQLVAKLVVTVQDLSEREEEHDPHVSSTAQEK